MLHNGLGGGGEIANVSKGSYEIQGLALELPFIAGAQLTITLSKNQRLIGAQQKGTRFAYIVPQIQSFAY